MFDREERKEYSFTVMAMDIGGRTGFTTLHITVDDENDNNPVFKQSDYKAIVRSNTTAGTVVLTVRECIFSYCPFSELSVHVLGLSCLYK